MCIQKHISKYSLKILTIKIKRGENLTENNDILRNLVKLLEEIANREKRKAVAVDDYGSALVLAILEGVLKNASSTLS